MEGNLGGVRISSSDRLALENISSSSISSSRNSGGTREARALVARAKPARWLARAKRVRWVARAKRVRLGRVRSTRVGWHARWATRANSRDARALGGTREARAFAQRAFLN